ELDADREDVALVGRLRADALHMLVDQILKLGALALEARRAHVGDIAGDDLDFEVHGRHSGRCGVESTHVTFSSKLPPYPSPACGGGKGVRSAAATTVAARCGVGRPAAAGW